MARDDSERSFWLSTVAIGGWVTLLMVIAGVVYTLFFAEPEHRLGVGAMVAAITASGAAALWVIPWDRFIDSRRMEAALLCWSLSTIGIIATMAALDGGADSPLAFALVLPTIFASLAYSPWRVAVIAITAELAFLALTPLGPPGPGYTVVFCAILAGIAVMAGWQARFHQEWRHRLAASSCTDPLTGLLNRRGLAIASDEAFANLRLRGRPVALLIIDLDLFKSYNDIHGHQAGDELLRWVAARLREAVRPDDAVARLGGDEFAVLLPGVCCGAETEPVVARIHGLLEPRIAHCLGCASAPEDGGTFDELYRAGDSSLYQSKLLRPAESSEDQTQVAFADRRRRDHLSADAILAGITEAFFVLDDAWRFTYVNDAAAHLLEHAAHELLGRSIWDIFPDVAGTQFEEAYRRVMERRRPERFSARYAPLERTFSVKASPVSGGVSVYLHEVSVVDPAGSGALIG